ncbi:ROK family protein [Streptacidiphilus monticola]
MSWPASGSTPAPSAGRTRSWSGRRWRYGGWRPSRRDFGRTVSSWAAVAPGVIRPDRILLTPNLPGWEGLALADRLAGEFGVPAVAVANDVRAGALAEARLGALRGADLGLYVSLGTGIAAALVVGGQVLAGAHQAAGEIGYMDPGGAPAGAVAAGRAPLEEAVAGKGLGERASALLGEEVTADQLFGRTDTAARELVAAALELLAAALGNLCVFADPERIVLGGGMMAAAGTVVPALTRSLAARVPFPGGPPRPVSAGRLAAWGRGPRAGGDGLRGRIPQAR